MKQLRNVILAATTAALLTSCTWAGAKRVTSFEELDHLATQGPLVEAIAGQSATGKQTRPDDVELYYYTFKPFAAPDAVIDWKYHYVIAPASRPEYPVRPFAKVTVFRKDRDDQAALKQLRVASAAVGADAIIDLVRIPQTGPMTGYRAEIYGYSYTGTAVARKAP